MALLREFAHLLDEVAWIGYLWPIVDPRRQTFADKILGTVVVDTRGIPATAGPGDARL